MEKSRKELLVNRICSGIVRLHFNDKVLIVKKPSLEDLYIGSEIYDEVLKESEFQGLYSDDELLEFMIFNGFWDDENENLLQKLPKEIEDFKVSLFKAAFKSNERKSIRKALAIAKSKLAEIFTIRNSMAYLSCSSTAQMAKFKYIFGCSLYHKNGQKVFNTEEDFWSSDSPILEQAMAAYSQSRIEESEFRELSRTDPWRQVWNAYKCEGSLFGVSPVNYTEEQTNLVNWSNLFDNIFQHQECPSDSIIEDDDILDGWIIDQKRKKDDEKEKSLGQDLISNKKIRDAQEVFIPAETKEDAKKVFNLNNDFVKATQKRRFETIRTKGQVNEADMPDTKMKIIMQKNNSIKK